MLADTRRSLEANDADGLRRAAHTLRGALGCFGAGEASKQANALENTGRARDLTGAAATLVDLEREVEHLRCGLAAICKEPVACDDRLIYSPT